MYTHYAYTFTLVSGSVVAVIYYGADVTGRETEASPWVAVW